MRTTANPADSLTTRELTHYKGLKARWHDWRETVERAIDRARLHAVNDERREVVRQIRHYLRRSGLTQAEFAARIGTSASRLSTYLSGKVTPSATLLVRMQRLGRDR